MFVLYSFDVADRQFLSIPSAWNNIYGGSSDVKELIPEFFFLPEFLTNINSQLLFVVTCVHLTYAEFDLGTRIHTGTQVNDVELPSWANSPDDFIAKHKQALVHNH